MTRRVRKKARNSASEGEQQPESSSAVSKRKKMPPEFRKARGKRGLLEKLAKDAPLDIFFEVSALHFLEFLQWLNSGISLDFYAP